MNESPFKDLALAFIKKRSLPHDLSNAPLNPPSADTLKLAADEVREGLRVHGATFSMRGIRPADILLGVAPVFKELNHLLFCRACYELILHEHQADLRALSVALSALSELFEDSNEHLLAVLTYKKMISNRINAPYAFNRIGLIFMRVNEHEQALINFKSAIIIQPQYRQALINAGVAHQNKGRALLAVQCFNRALIIEADLVDAYYNLGISYFSLENYAHSIVNLERSLALNPTLLDALYNTGVVYSARSEHRTALGYYARVTSIDPDYLLAHYNIGVCYFELMDYEQALLAYQETLRIDPKHIRAHWNASHCLLILGHLSKGFLHYEWRWQHNELQNNQKQRTFDTPLWRGTPKLQALRGATLLLHAEQGYGDTLQFARFVHILLACGLSVILEVPTALKELMQMSFPKAQVLTRQEPLPAHDMHCPLMSLPLALGIEDISQLTVKGYYESALLNSHAPVNADFMSAQTHSSGTTANSSAYLRVDASLQEYWAQQLNAAKPVRSAGLESVRVHGNNFAAPPGPNNLQGDLPRRPRVGIVWSSGDRADQQDTWEINRQRNVGLQELASVLELPVDWISLQIGEIPLAALRALSNEGLSSVQILDLSEHIRNFADTACIAQTLDLIITVDTSAAHLCAALGLPTWVLLKANACWRWFTGSDTSPWYPSVRLFRQRERAQWGPALDQLRTEIKKRFNL